VIAEKGKTMSQPKMVRINGSGEWGIKSKYDPELLPKLRALPGAQWNKDYKVWRVSTEDSVLLDLVQDLTEMGIAVPREIHERAQALAKELDIDGEAADSRAEDDRLYAYQKVGVRWMSRKPSALLADEMGLGKTVQALLAIPEGVPVVVACPASLKGNWRNECRTWRPDFRPVVLTGSKSWIRPSKGEMVILNYEILPDHMPHLLDNTYVVLDEIHMTKNPDAIRTERSRSMIEAALTSGGRAWGLTGTPMLNNPKELWQVLDNLQLAEAAFGSFRRFRWMFSYSRGGGWGRAREDADVPKRLEKVMLRREKKNVLPDLPVKRWKELPVEVSLKAQKELDRFWQDIQERVEAGELKLLPNGLPPFEEMSAVRRLLAEYKIPAMLKVIEEYEQAGEPLVVFSAHKGPVEAAAKRPGWKAIYGETPHEERTQILEDFQAGKLKGVAGTIKAMGVGHTLTHSSHEMFVDLEWTPALNTQAEDRIHRISQDRGCLYTILVGDHDLDRRMAEVLCEKKEIIESVIQETTAPKIADGASNLVNEAAVTENEDLETRTCPLCEKELPINTSGPGSKRPHTDYIRCDDCDLFAWKDQFDKNPPQAGTCPSCDSRGVIQISRSSKNKDRPYLKCRRCDSFNWMDEGDLPEEEKKDLRECLFFLLGRCDGARTLDNQGFNAYDGPRARDMARRLDAGKGINYRELKQMLRKYRKTQLNGAA
jgi:SWI/SNF-related matrix-associated actin-dependent regulator 1 of chromatin subfamily A